MRKVDIARAVVIEFLDRGRCLVLQTRMTKVYGYLTLEIVTRLFELRLCKGIEKFISKAYSYQLA